MCGGEGGGGAGGGPGLTSARRASGQGAICTLPSAARSLLPLSTATSAPPPCAGMPLNADRLWVYENFARYGAVAGLRILIDESTGLCNGTG